jgi:hypothetical protein
VGSTGLSQLLAATVDSATSARLRNSTEAQAMLALRAALRLAIGGEFDAQVRATIARIAGITAAHDVRRSIAGGQPIDHLVVAPSGVLVIDSIVCSAKVTYDDQGVLVDRGRQRCRHPMVDDVLREVASVAELAGPVPVHGLIVFRDLLSLPGELRSRGAAVKGVQLLTLPLLEGVLTRSGPVRNVEEVMQRLRDSFERALPASGDGLRLDSPAQPGTDELR